VIGESWRRLKARSERSRRLGSTDASTDRAVELGRLARFAAAGDRRALEQLVVATQTDVWRFCAHLTDRVQADDLTQETYLRAIPSLARFRGESTVMTWLLTIARRVVADELRRERRRTRLQGRLTKDAVESAVEDASEAAAWESYLGVLDPDRRLAFVLTQVMGYSYADAGLVAGCPVGTIRSRVSRARMLLLESLAGGGGLDVAAGQGD
jgi:RNA polymerase sigma-70 factor, ECF subfamily